jgi:TPR repeat protein
MQSARRAHVLIAYHDPEQFRRIAPDCTSCLFVDGQKEAFRMMRFENVKALRARSTASFLAMLALATIGAVHAGPLEEVTAAMGREDYPAAFALARPLAEQGNATAQLNLSWMYFRGKGVSQDYVAAMNWSRLAAGHGVADAQSNLGLLYRNGYGVQRDYSEALRWYRLAAAQVTPSPSTT